MNSDAGFAVCGTGGPSGTWHGTGSQDEYERVTRMPDCPGCVRRVGPAIVAAMTEQAAADAASSGVVR